MDLVKIFTPYQPVYLAVLSSEQAVLSDCMLDLVGELELSQEDAASVLDLDLNAYLDLESISTKYIVDFYNLQVEKLENYKNHSRK